MTDIRDWTEKVRDAHDADLLAVRDTDYLGLESLDDANDSKQWAIVVKEEILRRGLTA